MFFYARYAYYKNEYIIVDTANNMLYNSIVQILFLNGGLTLCQDQVEAETAAASEAVRALEAAHAADLAADITVVASTEAIAADIIITITTDRDFTAPGLVCSALARDGIDHTTADITVAEAVSADFSVCLSHRSF